MLQVPNLDLAWRQTPFRVPDTICKLHAAVASSSSDELVGREAAVEASEAPGFLSLAYIQYCILLILHQ